jgi:hypothetical protein
MNTRTNEVIESYVLDIMRRVPAKDRDDVGLELRGLLSEMLDGRAEAEGVVPHEQMVLEMLRDFGTPAEVAARYLPPPGFVIIPADQTRWFATLSIGGVGLQWALTLPAVFQHPENLTRWWLTWGLGSLWWPGFLVMTALVAAWVGQMRSFTPPRPKARTLDAERVNRTAMAVGLFWFAIGAAIMISLPFIAGSLPGVLPQVFAFDPSFVSNRAPPALILWLGSFATLVAVLAKGRWTPRLRWISIGFSFGFAALLAWWLAAGPIFLAEATNAGARGALALVLVIIFVDIGMQLYRQRARLPTHA